MEERKGNGLYFAFTTHCCICMCAMVYYKSLSVVRVYVYQSGMPVSCCILNVRVSGVFFAFLFFCPKEDARAHL